LTNWRQRRGYSARAAEEALSTAGEVSSLLRERLREILKGTSAENMEEPLVELLRQVVKRYKLQRRIDRDAKEIAYVAVRAYSLLASLSPVSEEALAERLREAVMTFVHELSP
jgi:SOS response regulatory protein OraA/RecX